MAKWRELGRRIDALDEIDEILTAMRSLAFIEVRRLADGAQRRRDTLQAIETAVADLAGHHPHVLPAAGPSYQVIVALGSERGLCGDHNDKVATALEHARSAPADRLLAVGAQLALRLQERGVTHVALTGPAMDEDVPRALAGIVAALEERARSDHDAIPGLRILHPDADGEVRMRRVWPMPALPPEPRWRGRPDLQVKPRALYAALVDHYLFTALEVALRASLLAENRKRLDQMEGAIDRLRQRQDELARDRRRARQEAITEEIEVILLGALPAAGMWDTDRTE